MPGVRNVFLGTSDFAVAVLEALAASPHRPLLVVTPPDRPRGRGRKPGPAPAAVASERLGIPVLRTPNVNEDEARAQIDAHEPEVATTAAFGQLIREPLLSARPMLNVHPSLLPRWRGAAPIERAIIAGDRETGVAVMKVAAELDAGPVAASAREPIRPEDDYGSLAPRLAQTGGRLLVECLGRLRAGDLKLTDQDDSTATYAEKIAPQDRRLDPARRAADLDRVVRALSPHIGAHVELADGSWLGVCRARPAEGQMSVGELAVRDDTLLLGCGEGVLELLGVKPAGGREMDGAAYARGHRVPTRAR